MMTRSGWLRNSVVIAAGVMFAMLAMTPAAYPRAKKKVEPTPTETPTPTATPTPEAKVWNFDQDKAGEVASGWKAISGDWQVIPDPSAPSPPNTFGLPPGRLLTSLIHGLNYSTMAVVDDPTEYSNFTMEASFKPAGGRFDCSGGIVFRYVDDKNFYLLSAGCPSDYFTLSRMSGGNATVLSQKVVPTDRDTWYKIKVVAAGDRFTCYNDDKMIYDASDSKIAQGRIGLWASNDSQARFDNVTIIKPLAGAEGGAGSATPAAPPPLPPPPH
ncbi:MAG TPA: family 16 glycoside hydrolase [Candidatus Binataceae bacterium]|nr:family 16 glycoside hydrolase [Candidatus Binataceae bacterium]